MSSRIAISLVMRAGDPGSGEPAGGGTHRYCACISARGECITLVEETGSVAQQAKRFCAEEHCGDLKSA